MKLSTRLIGSFILVCAITAFVGIFSLTRLAGVHRTTRDVVERRLPSSQVISAMGGALANLRIAELQFVLSTTPGQRSWYATETANQLATLEHERSLYEPLIASSAERELYGSFRANWDVYHEEHDRVLALASAGRSDSAKTLMRGVSQTAFDRASGTLQELIELTVKAGSEAAQASEAEYLGAQRFVLAGLIVTIMVSAALAAWLILATRAPLRGLMRAAERIGAGDMSHRAPVTRNDEIGQLASGFNLMVERLGIAQGELADVNRSLEDRVRARTVELEGANNDLVEALRELSDSETAARAGQERNRLLEVQFRQAQKMEAVGRLAGGVAHDFNNLLTVILAESESRAEGVPVDEIQISLDEINRAAMRGAGLTRQLLTFSRRQIIEQVTLDLNQVVASVDGMLRRLIGEDVELRTCLGAGLGSIVGDRGQLEQVIVNLVVNARDAMPDGGAIVIETNNAELDHAYAEANAEVAHAEYVMIAVSDTGAGMTDEVKAHIFEPFFTTKEVGKGTGLGLATCYSIVRQFGGHIVPSSEVGVGTTMRIYLPRVESTEPATRRSDAGRPRGGSETILVVEDEEAVRRTAVKVLERLGYTVLQAGDGEVAIAMLRQEPALRVDLLLTDVIMPKLGGRVVAEKAREQRPELKVLFMSGYSDDIILQNRLLHNEVQLLQKPFTNAGLARKVREALDRAPAPT